MASLTAVFDLVDRMSDKMDAIANRGESAVESWERMGEAADSAQEVGVAAAVGVASAVSDYGSAVEDAAGTTDYWTDAVGNYNKGAMEAMYSTEELVNMGYKSVEALEEERSVMELAQMATEDLSNAIEASTNAHDECAEAMSKAADLSEQMADSDKISQAAKEALQEATESAAAAMEELETAQKQAQDAQENYNAVAESGTASIGELEAAALRAAEAADNLTAANEKVTSATGDLSKANEDAAEEMENANKSGVDAFEGIASALAAAGITATVKEIAESVYDMADAFSEAESTVVLATGATGEALDDLTDSMMDAYAASKTGSLDDTAAAVGEINTRLGYTGDELTETTELFLDFADVTGGNAATSVKSVTQLMNQWNVSADEMESVLSKLTYAGQASGISVDTLSSELTTNKAVLDQLGFSLDEATAMFMNFELSGTQTTTVMTGLRTALSSGAISSLEELYDILDQLADGTMTAADATEIFGSRAGTAITNAAQQGVFELDEMVAALENSSGTLETTAAAAQTLDEKWKQATNNVSSAFTTTLEPSISGVSSKMAELVNGIGDFLNDHPVVVKAVTAIGAVLGTVAVAFAAVSAAVGIYNAVTAISTAVTTAFGVSLSAAILPITLIAAGIAAVVVVVSELIDVFGGADDEMQGMTATTKAQYYELEELNAEYERACAEYGETSDEASKLKYQIDDLSEAYEANKQSVEEYVAEVEDMIETNREAIQSYEDSIAAVDDSEVANFALIAKLDDLASSTDKTSETQTAMQTVIDSLNNSIDGLNLTYEDLIENQDATVQSIKEAAEAQAEQERQAEKYQEWIELLKQQAQYEEELAAATDEVTLAEEQAEAAHENYYNTITGSDWKAIYTSFGFGDIANTWEDAQDTFEAAQGVQDDLQAELDDTNAKIAELEEELGLVADAVEEDEDATVSFEDACTIAFSSVQDELDALIAAYDEAYESARESIDGQIGLFDTMTTETELSVQDMQSAFASQIEYLQTYTENLKLAAEYGIDDGLIASLSDGSEESAGYINAIVANIQSLDEGSEAAQAFVDDFNTSFQEVEQAKDDFATQVAEMETSFDENMSEIEARLAESIEEMNQEADAAAAATATINAYTQAIKDGQDSAVAAAEAVAAAVSTALASSSSTYSAGGGAALYVDEADANGTTNSADVFIAGEEGPELIVGKQGSTVFPNSETEKIIAAVSEPQQSVTVVNNTTESAENADTGGLLDKMELYLSRLTDKIAGLFGGQQEVLDVPAHASGTVSSEDSFIAGENGPELVVGHPDSTVFPSDETDRIVDAINAAYYEPQEVAQSIEQTTISNEDVLNEYNSTYDNSEDISHDYSRMIDQSSGDIVNDYEYRQENNGVVAAGDMDRSESGAIYVPTDSSETREDTSTGGNSGDRKITLEIEGKGNIQLQGGKVDEETMLSFLYEYLKPVLSEILKQEVYEEGDYSYGY